MFKIAIIEWFNILQYFFFILVYPTSNIACLHTCNLSLKYISVEVNIFILLNVFKQVGTAVNP